jgi:3-oxoacyl-[acyl-carrier-protein] synthase III
MMGVSYIDYYVPGEELPIQDFLDSLKEEDIPGSFKNKQEYAWFIENILKLKSVRQETTLDEAGMADGIIKKMFETQDIKPEDIDLIVFAQDLEYVQGENIAKRLQETHHMDRAFTINLTGNHCANIDVALRMVNSITRDDHLQNILIVGIKKSHTIQDRVFGTYGVLGDAAGIMLMNRKQGKYRVLLEGSVILSDGSFHNVDLNQDTSVIHCKNYVKCISELMGQKAVEPGMIEKVIIQNANSLLVTQCLASKGITPDKIFSQNQGRYGHLDCLDLLINLKDILDMETVGKKGYIMSFGTGYAGTYIASLLSFH